MKLAAYNNFLVSQVRLRTDCSAQQSRLTAQPLSCILKYKRFVHQSYNTPKSMHYTQLVEVQDSV